MESIWKKTAELPEFHTLTKDIRTKVLIIGGGADSFIAPAVQPFLGEECEAAFIAGSLEKLSPLE